MLRSSQRRMKAMLEALANSADCLILGALGESCARTSNGTMSSSLSGISSIDSSCFGTSQSVFTAVTSIFSRALSRNSFVGETTSMLAKGNSFLTPSIRSSRHTTLFDWATAANKRDNFTPWARLSGMSAEACSCSSISSFFFTFPAQLAQNSLADSFFFFQQFSMY